MLGHGTFVGVNRIGMDASMATQTQIEAAARAICVSDHIDQQLALQDLAYAHGMLAAINNPEHARDLAERRIADALKVLKATEKK
jgi:hypothetical protein